MLPLEPAQRIGNRTLCATPTMVKSCGSKPTGRSASLRKPTVALWG